MGFPQRYDPAEAERRWQETWARDGIYEFAPDDDRPIFAIDTPPPTVSGEIHIGHVYSYVQAEAMARFWRMQGFNVYYPFGFDDNGLPTERYVERTRGLRARDVGREAFISACLDVSREVEDRFEAFWKSLGMSVDWRLRYSTIDAQARRTSQWSFLDLYRCGLVYRTQAPNPWCVECQTAIAQAEMDDAERRTTFYTLSFGLDGADATLPIATTRPELLPACVAVFVHPDDGRFAGLVGQQATTPLFGRRVPILADPAVDPQKGSGAVMCCTFGDATDVAWWRAHSLPLIPLVTRQGRLGEEGGPYAGQTLAEARASILADLRAAGLISAERPAEQSIRVHERCGTPLEILETRQWFIRVLDAKEALLEAGRRISWHPAHMQTRYEHWVTNLSWDWCISRQRFFGVPFPLWHCDACGAVVLAEQHQLPIDPSSAAPPHPCACGNADLRPEEDVMDTWATSSVSPQIAGQMLADPQLFGRLFPMQLRPQAHDIIRTWAFSTIVKSHYHFGTIPWETLMISGHGLDASGHSIHKSKGNSPIAPGALIGRYGADAVRYWACGGSVGADQPLNEEAMKQGGRLVTKLWNAARFVAGQLDGFDPAAPAPALLPTDRALLSWLQRLILRATERMRAYDYAGARDAAERFFWGTFCDYYLELVKSRLYDGTGDQRRAAQYTLYHALHTVLKLLAPILPHITEEIYQRLFASGGGSIHRAAWPVADEALLDPEGERTGAALLELTDHIRRFKTARGMGLGTALARLTLSPADATLRRALEQAAPDLRSITRAQAIDFAGEDDAGYEATESGLRLLVQP
ncbi:MAG TPA: valine--tRNA ligase [Roseiflexaceae bacterium]|nr:valine--tRNA ligase [Roseiflexaceae bacterium]